MNKRRFFIRNMQAGDHLELFLVSSVSTILAIRGYLHITGYPQLGNSHLHIAHMLWGGLLMLVSMIILMTFLSKAAESLAVIIGGIGFGTFIDEVGKFVTQDHDYFFEPSVAIMYALFILIFLAGHAVQNRQKYSQTEYLMNAIRELEEVANRDLDAIEKERVLMYLDKSDPSNLLVSSLRQVIQQTDVVPAPKPGIYRSSKSRLNHQYRRIAATRWFPLGLIGFFLFKLFGSSSYVISVALGSKTIHWIEWGQLLATSLSAVFILWGILLLRKSMFGALLMFERSILISIFFIQVFIFYQEEFGALIGLTTDILILLAIRFMIGNERSVAPKKHWFQRVKHEL